ncbi:MAG: hypothetical protein KGD68_00500 [Candidatus Lokiarchaeota archaeon]|nr:hypothetical protein [Candidatus Lokiarchaeota archaeon]
MAKKKKEVCPYCGNSFAYLSRHKCKVKERVEGTEEEGTSESERRLERIEERKREEARGLKKDERIVLNIISREKDIYFEELIEITKKERIDLDRILNTLSLQSKIKVNRELMEASWTKHITINESYDVEIKDRKIDRNKADFILDVFSRQPCLICPFANKCNSTNLDRYNPLHCPWLSNWIETTLEGKVYNINFEDIEDL